MPVTLDQILALTRERIDNARSTLPRLERAAAKHTPRGFRRALISAGETQPAVIAELKRASPSKGVIRGSFPVSRLAMQLEEGGAAALSVLTEERYFEGSLANLCEASAATNLPCLRKDFIIDEFQIVEARANRADAVLLIAAALPDPLFGALFHRCRELGLDALVEVHDEEELARAVAIGAEIIGVNSRNLKTLVVDTATHARLARQLPRNVLRVAESGIANGKDIRDLASISYQAFLVGESLMRADDPGAALAQFLAAAKAPPLGSSALPRWSTGTKD